MFFIIFILPVISRYIGKFKIIQNLKDYPLRKWVMENLRCLDCGNLFASWKTMESAVVADKNMERAEVYCEHCQKSKIIGWGNLIDPGLKFIEQI